MTPDEFLAQERRVRDIVGKPYDDERDNPHFAERQLRGRQLIITAIDSGYEYANHAVIALRGSPTRGLVIVTLRYSYYDSRHLTTGRRLGRVNAEFLASFVGFVAGTPPAFVPATFRWASELPTT
jgi:hypothetical protein